MAEEPRKEAGKPAEKKAPDAWSGVGKLSTLGIEIGLTVAVLCLLGWWADGKWNTGPWLTLVGATIGIVGVTYKMLQISASMDPRKPLNQSSDTKDDQPKQ